MPVVVVDHVRRLSVSEEDGCNKLGTLAYLSAGLQLLANKVARIEEPLRRDETATGRRAFAVGVPGSILPAPHAQLVPCFFHWYGMSVCNYARLVGFLAGVGSGAFARDATQDRRNHQQIKDYCDDYVRGIPELEPIRVWRNKVFAHFALTDPRGDNAAVLDVSTMSMIAYINDRLRVGGLVIATRGAECEMPPWSVTESFAQLAPRYWPNQQVPVPVPTGDGAR
jgi:hypothetical protein